MTQLTLFGTERPLPGQTCTLEAMVEWICARGQTCPFGEDCAKQIVGPDALCLAVVKEKERKSHEKT